MELKALLLLFARKWWIILPTYVVTLAATVFFTLNQAPVYQAGVMLYIRPLAEIDDVNQYVRSLDVLSKSSEVTSTYAQVASSRKVKNQVADVLGLSEQDRLMLEVESEHQSGSNTIEVTVEGPDSALVSDFANAVGDYAVLSASELYEYLELVVLDQADQPTTPIRPQKQRYFAVGAVLGLVLGVGLALLVHSWQTSPPGKPAPKTKEE
jgi:capsular polysaccharide biosynthesis protein